MLPHRLSYSAFLQSVLSLLFSQNSSITFQNYFAIFFDTPSISKVFCRASSFFYFLYVIILIMSMDQQLVIALTGLIEKIFDSNKADQFTRVSIVRGLAAKYLKQSQKQYEYPFKELRTDNQILALETDENTPKSEEKNYPESSQYETPLSFCESKSKFSSYKIQQMVEKEQKTNEKKHCGKKQKVKHLLHQLTECMDVLVSSLHLAYCHILSLKMGKSIKFQTEAIYLKGIKNYLEEYKSQQQSQLTFQQRIDLSTTFIEDMIKKIPEYSAKFIDPSKQITVPLPSQLFKPHF